jgi:glucosamine-6-phosphate deaminase
MRQVRDYDQVGLLTLAELQRRTRVPIEVVADKDALAVHFARVVLGHVRKANARKKSLVIIMPVGPTGQWRLMADMAAKEGLSLLRLSIVQMDEYLTADSQRLPLSHPFSFTGFIWKNFAREATRECGFRKENWIVPDPGDTGAVERVIEHRGGVDVAFAGIGLNGHIAFNEPPLPSESWTEESFAASSTRIIKVAETTEATNSIFGTGGDLGQVADYAVTIGMKQILNARQVHVFLDWPWQRFVFRRTLLGPVSRFFPASLLQRHKNVRFSITEEVAQVHALMPE